MPSNAQEGVGRTFFIFFGEFLQYFRVSANIRIWLIFTRSSPPLEICRWFPQIVFILLTCVRPINVIFSNRFFCLSDKRCLMLIIKKNYETYYRSARVQVWTILKNCHNPKSTSTQLNSWVWHENDFNPPPPTPTHPPPTHTNSMSAISQPNFNQTS